jgi:hypothetical protein
MRGALGTFFGPRRALRRRDAGERNAWPVQLAALSQEDDRAVISRGMGRALGWLEAAAAHWNCGGFAARYDLRTHRYQGPYPETTGYLVPTLLQIADIREEHSTSARALSAGQWLRSRQREDGSVRCNIDSGPDDRDKADAIVLFDCGAILQGFSALARQQGGPWRESASRLGRFLCESQRADGFWDRHLYFPTFGTHNALVAYALIDAGRTIGEPRFADAGRNCLTALRPRILPSGFIEGCEFGGDPQTMFLHPYAYTLEGYVKAAMVDDSGDNLAVAEHALERMAEHMDRRGVLPAAYLDRALAPVRADAATTGLAQLAGLFFKVARFAHRDDFSPLARRIMSFLRGCMFSDEAEAGARGGIPASFPVGGGYGPYTINNWTMKYFLDASLEELAALEAGRT